METSVLSATDDGHIKFVSEISFNFIIFKRKELEEFLKQVRESFEPNIPHPFKFRNLFKKVFNIKQSYPRKITVSNRSRAFTFDEESLRNLFEIEKMIYEHLKICQKTFPNKSKN